VLISYLVLPLVLLAAPHVVAEAALAWDLSMHGGFGPGAGARVEFPMPANPGDLVFGAGLGWLYFACPYATAAVDCPNANALFAPLTLAWSFRVSRAFDVFVEPGMGAFVAFFREACPLETCTKYDHFGLRPLITLGAVLHAGPVRIEARAGFPAFSLGVGF